MILASFTITKNPRSLTVDCIYTMAFYYKPLSTSLWPFLFSCFASISLISLSEATKNGGMTIDLIHRDSSLSPLYDPSKTRFELLRSSFDRSFSRLNSLKSASTSEPFDAPLTPVEGEYLMKIRIGTPPVEVLAIADTGSDLTWIQCKPCPNCYKQKAPFFDPRKSKTYKNVSCSSKQCEDLGEFCHGDTDSKLCQYQVIYADRSVVNGDLAVETFSFDSVSRQNVSFSEVAFGCVHASHGTFFSETSGLIGLGGGPVSIVRQLQKYIGGKFSYCLTSHDSNVSGKISFGSNAVVSGPKVLSTPLVKGFDKTFYFVTLEGFSVGNKKFEYYKKSKEIEQGNIFIDTGTKFTILQRSFYNELESMLVKAINGSRVSDPRGIVKLCYELPSNGEFQSPPVIAHFRGADLELQHDSVFVEVEKGVVCLSLVPSDSDIMIFGNLNQINYVVGYDLENEVVNFLPTDCTKHHS